MREAIDRNDLAKLFFERGYTVGAEVGVFRGDYSEVLIEAIPGLFLYCIDPWRPFEANRSSRNLERHFRETTERLSNCNVKIIRKTSADALADIPDGSLDFVYIDAIHDYENALHDIAQWSKKVRIGGIVSGHDYCCIDKRGKIYGVIQAVDEYIKANNIDLFVTGEDDTPSFYWEKRGRVAVISANIGNFDKQNPYVEQSVEYDNYYFNDNNFQLRESMTPRLQAKIPKLFGWQIVPAHDYYIWVDSSCALLHKESVSWFIEHCGDADLAFFQHPVRDTAQEEADYLKKRFSLGCKYCLPRYEHEFLDELMEVINSDKDFVDDHLFTANAFIYRNNEKVQNMMRQWWYYVTRFHVNDQLSLPYVMWKSGCTFNILPSERRNYTPKTIYVTNMRGKRLY
jgi:hypothetical protein